MHKSIKTLLPQLKLAILCVFVCVREHICVRAQIRVCMLLVHKIVDLSRWCLNAVMASTPLCSVVCPESIKKSPSRVSVSRDLLDLRGEERKQKISRAAKTWKCFFIK